MDQAAAALKKVANALAPLEAQRKKLLADVPAQRALLQRVRTAPAENDPPVREVRTRLESLEAELAETEDRAEELRDALMDAEGEEKAARVAYGQKLLAIVKPRQRALVISLLETFRSLHLIERELKELELAATRYGLQHDLPHVPTAVYGQSIFLGDPDAVNTKAWLFGSTLELCGFRDLTGGKP